MRLYLLFPVSLTTLLFLVVSSCNRELPAQDRQIQVRVNASDSTTPMPRTFRAGLYTFSFWEPPPPYVQKKLFEELKPGIIEIDLGNPVMKQSRNLEDLLSRLRTFDEFLTKVKLSGGELVVAINWMPDWLSSNLKDRTTIANDKSVTVANLSPPADYERWARVVEAIATHIKRDLGIDARYKIWWEPDIDYWQGTEAEYFKLYRYSVLGLRRADPKALVGGPSVSNIFNPHWRDKKVDAEEPMLRRFIAYCAQNPLPELGLSRLPIDFLVWHQFNANPYSGYEGWAVQTRKWLAEFGYPVDTEQFVGEWSSWDQGDAQQLSAERDRPYIASYVVSSLIEMDKAGIHQNAFTSLIEQQTVDAKRFSGGFGLFTKDLIVKPVFNAFKAVSRLGSKRVAVELKDPFARAVASSEGDTVAVLISNYVPQPSMVRGMPGDKLLALGYDTSEIRRHIPNETATGLLEGRISIDNVDVPAKMKQDIRTVLAEKNELTALADRRRTAATPINLTIDGLSSDFRYSVEYFLIDDSHANSFAQQERIDRFWAAVKKDAAGIVERTREAGYSEREIELVSDVLSGEADNPKRRMRKEDRDRVTAIFDELTLKVFDEMNNWPEIALTAVEQKKIESTSSFKVRLDLQPYAVALVVLRRQSGE